jgi:hypothetical protein
VNVTLPSGVKDLAGNALGASVGYCVQKMDEVRSFKGSPM